MHRIKNSFLLWVLLLLPQMSQAGYVAPNAERPPIGALPTGTGVNESTNFLATVATVINWVLGFVGIIIFGIFLFAGFQYATAGGDEDQTEDAQKTILNAVIGMLIIFFAFVASNALLSFVFNNTATN